MGYKEALKKHNIPLNEDLIEAGIPCSGKGILNKLLNLEKKPTAIFDCNDLMAIKAITAAKGRSLSIPAAYDRQGQLRRNGSSGSQETYSENI